MQKQKHETMNNMTSQQKRQWAMSMYIHENRTQEEIADAVGVSRQTIVRWAKADNWQEQKASLTMTTECQIKALKQQIVDINDNIAQREVGKRHATPREADTISKLTNAINKLETDAGIHDVVSVGQRFIAWLRPIDLDQTKKFTQLFDSFINSLM